MTCDLRGGRFAINLQVGPNVNPRDDIALHVNPRFDENCVVRNSLIYQSWGDEERHPNFMPLQRGVNFEILILCEQAEYKVGADGGDGERHSGVGEGEVPLRWGRGRGCYT